MRCRPYWAEYSRLHTRADTRCVHTSTVAVAHCTLVSTPPRAIFDTLCDSLLFLPPPISPRPSPPFPPSSFDASRYVTQEELKAMMAPSSGLLWSPWFRVIAEQFLGKWWADLDKSLNTTELVETDTIHRYAGHTRARTYSQSTLHCIALHCIEMMDGCQRSREYLSPIA